MVRRLAVLGFACALAALSTGCTDDDSRAAPSTARIDLRITVWPRGAPGRHRTWTLRCGPARGTLPRRERACRRLARLRRPFRPTPRNVACTEIYGGPQVAHVSGRVGGRRVNTRITRVNGCEIERWNRVAFLLPAR